MAYTSQFKRITAIILLVIFTLTFIHPGRVLAQDEIPVDSAPVEEVTQPVVEEPVANPEAVETPAPEEVMTPAEVVEALPEGVELNVVDENGEPVALASAEAVEIVALPDPKYTCVGGTHAGVHNFTSIQAAIDDMADCISGGGTVGGELTVEAGAYNEDVVLASAISGFSGITGAGSGTTTLYSLNFTNQTSNLLFSGLYLSDFMNVVSSADITLNDISVDGGTNEDNPTGNGIYLETEGDVTLTDVVSNNADSSGIKIVGAHNTHLTNVDAFYNAANGLRIYDVDNLHLDATDGGWNVFAYNGEWGMLVEDTTNTNANYVQTLSNDYDGINIFAYNQGVDTVNLNHIYSNWNDGSGIQINGGGWMINTVNINNASVYQNGVVQAFNGASIYNAANVTVANSDFIGNGWVQLGIYNDDRTENDLRAPYQPEEVPTNVTLYNVYAQGNGSYLDSARGGFVAFGWDNIQIGGTNSQTVQIYDTMTENSYCNGIHLFNNGVVTLAGVAALHNGYGENCSGTYIENTYGSIAVSDSAFNFNAYAGLDIYHVGADVSLNGVTAAGNGWYAVAADDRSNGGGGYGILVSDVADEVEILNSMATNNWVGIQVVDTGKITLSHVFADYNMVLGAGLYGNDDANYRVVCSSFSYNGITQASGNRSTVNGSGSGLIIEGGQNALLAGVTAHDNHHMDIDVTINGKLVTLSGCNVEGPEEETTGPGGLIVPVQGGEQVNVDCGYTWTQLDMEPGDKARFDGFCGITASFDAVAEGSLPGTLPDGYTFGSGYTEAVVGAANGVIPNGGTAELSLVVPEGKTPVIFYWDAGASKWVEVPVAGSEGSFSGSDAGMQVLSGVSTSGGMAHFTVNFTGTFIVVYK